MRAHIKERGVLFHRFAVLWTPSVLFLDPSGVERRRMEGYLPRDMFFGELYLGLARVSFMRKDWAEAERIYDEVATRWPSATAAPEAMYWRAVSRYKRTNDHSPLQEVAKQLSGRDSAWASKASVWATE
jgi:hypothetical protein